MYEGRTILIGLDGVPVEVIKRYAEDGTMPNMAKLIEKSVFRQTQSSIPEVSSTAWSSIITGTNPGEHGIYGFTELRPNSYKLRFPNYNDVKVKPFWERWDGESVIVNVPATYPVRPMNGAHISGFVSIDINKSVYPREIIGDLQELDYRLDVDSRKAHRSMEDFLDDLDLTLDARIAAYRYLWNEYKNWKTFMLVFTGTDRLMHFLYKAFEQEDHLYSCAFRLHFSRIDHIIGEIVESLHKDDLLVIMSDHGFEVLDNEIFVNKYLEVQGYLSFEGPADWENISGRTKAFALDPARIYINRTGKYPRGCVGEAEAESLISELAEMFEQWEIDGKKVIRSIYRSEALYSGPEAVNAPDLVLVANKGFNLKGAIAGPRVVAKGIFSGKHTQDTSFCLYYGLKHPENVPETLRIDDIIHVIERERVPYIRHLHHNASK
ncbi:MAG: alkaline phosphatase family protein [Phycisphaerae bacterium]|jgi:predicted AlkP superfamily phosphohydrolase/phosphomutase